MTRKNRIRAAIVTATALVTAGTVTAGVSMAGAESAPKKPSKKEIAALFDGWNKSLRTGDPKKVADRYAKDAVLLPTVSNKVRTDRAGIVDYFHHFLENKPQGKKIQTIVNVLDGNSAIDTGVYQFTLTDPKTGEKRVVKARYTYEYEKRDGIWKIVNHHSSAMPEG
ncbi:SgcJ/EcaC family oxidoreductase [Streptomyces neyagawaensis]|uniref:SgcJ/EcaC family oxidoreductase n=1 Tax=Streptomyces neyagawaensis TaxID=42238 RepID=UPI0006E36284|nr:SgcJ/EcaC family oxidoreductase [Streptomyces neyagawaensis]MCL6736251.1 SgcJ/EcaC family oxidoreductase [Streptomyces neyagawaensis]MDE1684212.1 SgcJ/EcaC family oxidoreductase [Streptomyces neyagawaensis]